MRHTLIAAITVLMMMVGIVPGHAEKRVALVIGNSAYRNEPSLRNPANDAAAMVELFRSARFDVVEPRSNVGNAELRRAIRDFADSARDADMAVVFYSGHGIEVDGTNYLIPVDARLERDFDVEDETVSLDRVLKAIEPARMRIVILDACRDNPFQRTMKLTIQTRSIRRGLADVQLPMSGMLVAFAARAGTAAEDGDGRNSPFTAALLKNIATPGLDVRLAFGKVRDEVLEATAGRQEPFIYHSLGGQTVSLVAAPPPPTNEPAPVLSVTSEAAQAWAVTRDTTSQAVLEDFIRQFGTTVYGSMARARLEEFKKTQVAALALEQRKIEQQELARSLQRFDGTWLATKTCPRGDGALGFTWQFIADVKAGVFHGQHGAVGKPDSQTFDGKIQPDGAALISVVGLTGASASTPGRPPPGTPLSYIVNATFQDSTGRGTQLAPGRTCNFAFAKLRGALRPAVRGDAFGAQIHNHSVCAAASNFIGRAAL